MVGEKDGLIGLVRSSSEGVASVKMKWDSSLGAVRFHAKDDITFELSTFFIRFVDIRDGSIFSASSSKVSDGEYRRLMGEESEGGKAVEMPCQRGPYDAARSTQLRAIPFWQFLVF